MLTRRQRQTHRYSISPYVRMAVAAGLLCLAAMAGANAARADGIISTAAPPLSMLVKFDDRNYQLAYEDWVSLDPIRSATVRKIGYGNVTDVNIATTDTGTYSSDAMTSPYVRYPGIAVARVPEDGKKRVGHRYSPFAIGPEGNSIYSVSRSPAGNLTFRAITPVGTKVCSSRGSFTACTVSR